VARVALGAAPHIRATHDLLAWTGLRASEACALRWADVDQSSALITVRQGKGDRDRVVPVPRALLAALRADTDRRAVRVLHSARDPTAGITRRQVHRRIAALGAAAGIPLHPHTLRHLYACRCLRAGLTIMEVSALLGHSDIGTTALYLHVWPDELASRVQALLAPSMAPRLAL